MMKKRKLLKRLLFTIFLALIAFISFALFQTTDDINADLSNIDEKLANYYNPSKMGGFAVAVFKGDDIIYSKGYGYSNTESKQPYTTKTQQYIASISKTTIGVALLKAQELGLLKLDDPINKHLSFNIFNPNFPNDQITIEQLANHTSSLDYNELVVESLYIEETRKEIFLESFMVDYFQNGTYGEVKYTKNPPGSDWNYSNIGASLAAYIIETSSGISFADFTTMYIFEPLQMKNTFWSESESDSLVHTSYYESTGNKIVQVKTGGVILYPSRDLITNIEDLTIYCQAIIKKRSEILQPNSFRQLLSPSVDPSTTNMEDDNYSVFFMIDRGNYGINYQLIGMDGGDNCIKTMMWFDPKTELGYIFLGNTGGDELNRLNHIFIYNSLVSLGYNYSYENATLGGKIKLKWHNVYNRVRALF